MSENNGKIKIDKDIPIPAQASGYRKYPWREMEVGDSFFVAEKRLRGISAVACQAGTRCHKKFSVRSVTENGIKGVRVWRVA